jgi:lipoyl(octanoyl) transferase
MEGVLVDSVALDVFGQMAVDEALAKSRPNAFCLRFFRWQGNGATFGYAQRIREVEPALPPDIGDSYTRRPTGGGLVPHLDDLTFSCIFPDGGMLRPMEIYRRLHSAILTGLREAGLDARLCVQGGSTTPNEPGEASRCFEKPVALDILSGKDKILGGAIRRYGAIVLYQGSLRLPGARNQAGALETMILRSLATEWGLRWIGREPDALVKAEATALEEKYRSPEWIRKI